MSEIDWASLQKEAKDVLIPDGDYVTIVTKAEATRASTGKPMIKLQLTIADGPKRDRRVFTQLTLTADNPFALQKWFSNLAAFGLDSKYFDGNPSLERIATDLMNRGVIITVGHREWQGADRNEVSNFKPFVPTGPIPPGMVLGAATTTGPTINAPTTSTPAAAAAATPSPTTTTAQPSTPPPARPF